MMTVRSLTVVRRAAGLAALGAATALFLMVKASAAAPRFLPDDPLPRETDPFDASHVRPAPIPLAWDLISSLFERPGDRATRRATNINTIDEVPDSSWFTNRVGSAPLTEADIARGPDTTAGPASGVWTVVAGKSEGIRPGFTIVDSAHVRWFLKFDAPGYPEQATGAEVVATKLFWALGYNVPETHVAPLRRENLVIAPDATISINGKRRQLTTGDVDRVLGQVERSPDGSYRALASKALEGKPLGGFRYYGTRPDDPNDVVPHENRRELRGMGVFASWIDRVDAKAGNTLDTLVTENGKSVVRHHVLDFGSTLGSGGIAPNDYWEGYQYIFAGSSLLKKLLGFGFPVEPWRTIRYATLRGVGRFEGDHFDPRAWKSRVPNAAYLRAQPDDTFWAARKVVAFTDMIAAAVRSGQYSDPAAELYLTRTLIERRDAIGRAYLGQVNPIVNPVLDAGGVLTFDNAAAEAGALAPSPRYRAEWYVFDNATRTTAPLGTPTDSSEPAMHGPTALPHDVGSYVRVDISAIGLSRAEWASPVQAYFRRGPDAWSLVGLERRADSNASPGDGHTSSN